MQTLRIGLWLLVFCAVVVTGVEAYRGKNLSEPVQDVTGLDRRISSLEQRLYSIESSISRLQLQASSSMNSSPSQTGRDPEVDRLRGEVELLNARVRELECGVAHLDERTLSAAAKEARSRAGAQSKDPCRLNPETTVRLSSRP
ncbi:MAG: hypothetical protein WBV94_12315 [Blastocatellia bacterium]